MLNEKYNHDLGTAPKLTKYHFYILHVLHVLGGAQWPALAY